MSLPTSSLLVYGFALMSLNISASYASYPEMTMLDDYCNVEVRVGSGGVTDPYKLPISKNGGGVSRGEKFTGGEGQQVCVRREAQPKVCSTPLETHFFCVKGWDGLSVGQPERSSH